MPSHNNQCNNVLLSLSLSHPVAMLSSINMGVLIEYYIFCDSIMYHRIVTPVYGFNPQTNTMQICSH